jgi:hypothetical protein
MHLVSPLHSQIRFIKYSNLTTVMAIDDLYIPLISPADSAGFQRNIAVHTQNESFPTLLRECNIKVDR